mmetsp:Transcript_7433/g.17752  ORF Transcript_7433/g.17752 Transcript_7433/m.17752 type:complete len:323 (+) Transcript_7433:228-1196(+)
MRSSLIKPSAGSMTPPLISMMIFQMRSTSTWASTRLSARCSAGTRDGARGFQCPKWAMIKRTCPRCTSSTTSGCPSIPGATFPCTTSTTWTTPSFGRSVVGWRGRIRRFARSMWKLNGRESCDWQRLQRNTIPEYVRKGRKERERRGRRRKNEHVPNRRRQRQSRGRKRRSGRRRSKKQLNKLRRSDYSVSSASKTNRLLKLFASASREACRRSATWSRWSWRTCKNFVLHLKQRGCRSSAKVLRASRLASSPTLLFGKSSLRPSADERRNKRERKGKDRKPGSVNIKLQMSRSLCLGALKSWVCWLRVFRSFLVEWVAVGA